MELEQAPNAEVELALTQRERVERLEQAMLGLPQATCPVRHYFAPGVFIREMNIPKGVVVTGAVHKTENLAILMSGVLDVVTPDGAERFTAPHVFRVKPGAKNCVFAVETAVWANVMPNPDNETSIDVLVERFTESKASELLGGPDNKQLAADRAAEIEGVPV